MKKLRTREHSKNNKSCSHCMSASDCVSGTSTHLAPHFRASELVICRGSTLNHCDGPAPGRTNRVQRHSAWLVARRLCFLLPTFIEHRHTFFFSFSDCGALEVNKLWRQQATPTTQRRRTRWSCQQRPGLRTLVQCRVPSASFQIWRCCTWLRDEISGVNTG